MNHKWLVEKCKWSIATFGKGQRSEGVLKHIESEISEVRENPKDLEEWIDIVLLALDGAFRAGHSPQEICNMLIYKQAKNTRRRWDKPKPNELSHHKATP